MEFKIIMHLNYKIITLIFMHNVKMKTVFMTILLRKNVHMGNNFEQIKSNITHLMHIYSVLSNVKLPKTRALFRDETMANKTFQT